MWHDDTVNLFLFQHIIYGRDTLFYFFVTIFSTAQNSRNEFLTKIVTVKFYNHHVLEVIYNSCYLIKC